MHAHTTPMSQSENNKRSASESSTVQVQNKGIRKYKF